LRLSLAEREENSRGLAAGESSRAIARHLGRAPSTISREVRANGGRTGYRAMVADEGAWRRVLRPKQPKLADRPELWVSAETIYQSLYVQAGGALRKELTAHMRRPRTKRRPRGHSTFNGQGQLRGVVNISQRPLGDC